MSSNKFKKNPHDVSTVSLTRYRYLSEKIRYLSLTRALQYELLESIFLKGDVLDFGGGENALYRNIIQCSSYKSVNIDPNVNPTWVIGVDEKIPCQDSMFDTVISMNTLEHIFEARLVLDELFRVLKPGGELLLSVPFLFPVHGHPDDFFRPTSSWFVKSLTSSGFSSVEILPLFWGPFTTGMICSGLPGPAKKIRKQLALFLDLLYAKLRTKANSNSVEAHANINNPLAFFVRAVR